MSAGVDLGQSLVARRFTAEERRAVVALREAKGWGPKKLAKATGIPEPQIRFWLTSSVWLHRSAKRLRFQDWESWRAEGIRTALLRAAKQYPHSGPPPTRPELVEWLRGLVMACGYCDVALTPKNFSVDHRQPVTRGGVSTFENLLPCCKRCNTVKGTLTEAEYRSLLALVRTWEDGGKTLFSRLLMGHSFVTQRRA